MRILWVIGAAWAGRKVLGLPGAVLSGGLGFLLGTLFSSADAPRRTASSLSEESERYPEEAIIDAMQETEREAAAEGEGMADLFSAVSGRKSSHSEEAARKTEPG